MLYQSKRDFKIWGYTVSHSSLLLRSNMKFSDEENYSKDTCFNIDIEFWDVTYIGIPVFLNNIAIKEITIDLLPSGIDKNLCRFDRKIFEFTVDHNKYLIIAGGLLIGTNHWVSEDRIFDYHLNLEHDNIIITT